MGHEFDVIIDHGTRLYPVEINSGQTLICCYYKRNYYICNNYESNNSMSLKNPFVISGYVSPYYFCDREEETKNLIRYVTNGRNVALISTRRMGKTGLIRHCFQSKEIRDRYHTFFIDIYSTGP